MTTSGDADSPKPPGKLSRVTDWIIYACIGGLLLVLVTRGNQGPQEGAAAQPFDLQLVDGAGQFRLEEHRGKPVLLEVFASWCGACENAAPMLQQVYRDAQQNGVVMVGVSIDDDANDARGVKRDWPIPYPVALDDGSVKRAYGVSLVPTFVLIDREGTIKRVSTGVPSRRTLSRWLTEL